MTEIMQPEIVLSCEAVQERLTAILDNELAPEEAAMVQTHLDGCAACRQEREELAAGQDMAGRWPAEAERDLWPALQFALGAPVLDDMLAELRALREETQALRGEVARLRRELADGPVTTSARSTPLDLPYVPKASRTRFQIV